MTTAIAHELEPSDHRPNQDLRVIESSAGGQGAHSRDATQGRQIGSRPHDDATQGRQIGSRPEDDATQARVS
jgi:hypothetical protein